MQSVLENAAGAGGQGLDTALGNPQGQKDLQMQFILQVGRFGWEGREQGKRGTDRLLYKEYLSTSKN